MTKTITEQILNLQKMVEDECSRRCELETKCSQLEKRLEVSEKAHYRTLEQLRIATGALRELEVKSDKFYRGDNDWSLVEQLDFIKSKCQETLYYLKEMEGVK